MTTPTVAITGAHGFLGWHLACRLRAVHGVEPLRLGRKDFADPERLRAAVGGVDTIYHVAGVNRAGSDEEVRQGNLDLACTLAEAIRASGRPVHVVYANSIQSDDDNAYGRGKRDAAEVLGAAAREVGGSLADVLLPNLFGEHGRPSYNSFVATFADAVADGREPTVSQDRQVPLLHAQRAAACLVEAAGPRTSSVLRPAGTPRGVAEVRDRLKGFHACYGERGEIPDLTDDFSVDLFNTYRSYLFPHRFPIFPAVHADPRGELFETVRAHGGTGQAFVSTTVPGATRGDHYHLSKVERFFVLKGEAEISLRRLLHDEVVTFRVSGERPGFVDMPTMWVHNITNVGDSELVTLFWADQLLDPVNPDQYPERVEVCQP
jgi:UDP-2-acetamido-2,6-beta-L-arabino-hexul-4-ose reductase